MDKIKNFNRLNDVYFKNLLTDEHNKQITICFLNDILEREGNQIFTEYAVKPLALAMGL